jgi:hypothetical protein
LNKAVAKYKAVKQVFPDSTPGGIPQLYTSYVIDDGKTCTQIPRRFYASVNGNMIWSGWQLAHMVTDGTASQYVDDYMGTAQAVVSQLSDPAGVFENLEAGVDSAEPMVEAMYVLATDPLYPQPLAKNWILTNAAVVAANVRTDGTYGRLLGGPATSRANSASDLLSTAGAYALVMASDAFAPTQGAAPSDWNSASYVDVTALPQGVALTETSPASSWPLTITFTGHGIALIGTRGEGNPSSRGRDGHARVFIDGLETSDQTGIWQASGVVNSVTPPPYHNDVLFAWQWPYSSLAATHTVAIQPGVYDPKEGHAYIHIVGYYVLP